MQKKDKLVIGEPYEIIVRKEGCIIKVSGSNLTKDDVKKFIASGFIDENDVVKEVNAEEKFPNLKIIEDKINGAFPDFASFCKRMYENYPSILFQMLLKEYSKISISGHTLKRGDIVYLISLIDYSIVPYRVSGMLGELDDVSTFITKEDATIALKKVLFGLSRYGKLEN